MLRTPVRVDLAAPQLHVLEHAEHEIVEDLPGLVVDGALEFLDVDVVRVCQTIGGVAGGGVGGV